MISKRIYSIAPSITLAISAKARQLKDDGVDVVGFGAGEPDFDTPVHIKEAAKKAVDAGFTRYTPVGGTPELKKAICSKFKKDNGLDFTENQVLVSCGAKHSLFNAILTVCQEQDEVIVPVPYWVSYPEMVKASGAKPVLVETDEKNGFKITAQQLKNVVTRNTKIFILNSPSNPTGAVYSREELNALAEVIVENDLLCISDEIYEKIIYQQASHISIASLGEKIKKRTIVVNGVSKSYAMTGWRIGYSAAQAAIIQAMASLQSHSTSNPSSISQKAALAALQGPQDCVGQMMNEFLKRRDYITDRLNSIQGVTCLTPGGAFYVFPSIERILGKSYKGEKIKGSLRLCELLLDEARVAAVPGIAFGNDSHIRLSYATSMENIEKGLDRIEELVVKLQ